jgi:hypothetical protein
MGYELEDGRDAQLAKGTSSLLADTAHLADWDLGQTPQCLPDARTTRIALRPSNPLGIALPRAGPIRAALPRARAHSMLKR